MKQIGSAITGFQNQAPAQRNSTGSQPGETGAAPSQTTVAPRTPPEQVDRALPFLRQFALRALKGDTTIDPNVERGLALLEGSCDWNLAHAHLIEILDAYAKPGVSQEVLEIRARDFMAELDRYPTWAVVRAFRWWKSDQNQYRYRAPLPGDLTEHAHKLVEPVRVARGQLDKILSRQG